MTNPTQRLAENNVYYLRQGEALLEGLSDAGFSTTGSASAACAIGVHIRHVLDHYQSFLKGIDSGCIDYDDRQRDPALESNREFALTSIRMLIARLQTQLEGVGEEPVAVLIDCGDGERAYRQRSQSTINRELQFLISHTVHHYALIANRMAHSSNQLPENFGIAPSTVRHRTAQR